MRSSDQALWASVATTLRDVVLPALGEGHVRDSTIQLVGLAEYALGRGPDPAVAHEAELAAVLGELADNPLVPADGSVAERASAALVAAVGRSDGPAEEIRRTLRPVLVRHLDEDVSTGEVLGEAFRGRAPGG